MYIVQAHIPCACACACASVDVEWYALWHTIPYSAYTKSKIGLNTNRLCKFTNCFVPYCIFVACIQNSSTSIKCLHEYALHVYNRISCLCWIWQKDFFFNLFFFVRSKISLRFVQRTCDVLQNCTIHPLDQLSRHFKINIFFLSKSFKTTLGTFCKTREEFFFHMSICRCYDAMKLKI